MDEDLHDEDGYIRDVTRRGGKGGRARQLSAAMIGGRRTVRAKADGNLAKSKLNNRRGKEDCLISKRSSRKTPH